MIDEKTLLERMTLAFPSPDWHINTRKSGQAIWVHINDSSKNNYQVQVTPTEGIGVSVVQSEKSDMSGHDHVFKNLTEVIDFIKSCSVTSPM